MIDALTAALLSDLVLLACVSLTLGFIRLYRRLWRRRLLRAIDVPDVRPLKRRLIQTLKGGSLETVQKTIGQLRQDVELIVERLNAVEDSGGDYRERVGPLLSALDNVWFPIMLVPRRGFVQFVSEANAVKRSYQFLDLLLYGELVRSYGVQAAIQVLEHPDKQIDVRRLQMACSPRLALAVLRFLVRTANSEAKETAMDEVTRLSRRRSRLKLVG